jgi:hypothetical protein
VGLEDQKLLGKCNVGASGGCPVPAIIHSISLAHKSVITPSCISSENGGGKPMNLKNKYSGYTDSLHPAFILFSSLIYGQVWLKT